MRAATGGQTTPLPPAYVPRATARRDWFLSAAHLREHAAQLTTTGGADGLKRTATFYRVRDLDRLALLVHGPCGLARKRAARDERAVTAYEKESSDQAKKRLALELEEDGWGAREDVEETGSPPMPVGRRRGNKGRTLVKKQLVFVDDVHDERDTAPRPRSERR